MRVVRRSVVVIAVAATIGATGCSGGSNDAGPTTSTRAAGISAERAIEIARGAWAEEEPGFDFSTRRAEVSERGATFDIAFVDLEVDGARGEPHVVVDRRTGEARDTYRTR